MLTYPAIDPVAIHIGKFGIRWYSLAYLAGILLGWWYVAREHARKPIAGLTRRAMDDMVVWAVIGIIGGGRLGYVLFYKPGFYLEHPLLIFKLWEGGMSFHGGLIGIILAFFLFCRRHGIRLLELMDVIACAAPIGIFFGRIANFINAELYGHPTGMPWGMVFPGGGDLPRHPSQLYEAAFEGILLFALLTFLLKRTNARDWPGLLSGAFLVFYSLSRMFVEHFREPDAHLGYIFGPLTMGQLLSLPMLALGLYLACKRKKPRTPA